MIVAIWPTPAYAVDGTKDEDASTVEASSEATDADRTDEGVEQDSTGTANLRKRVNINL